jgi:hypothetical protein
MAVIIESVIYYKSEFFYFVILLSCSHIMLEVENIGGIFMDSMIKKTIVYSMVGLMQFGFFATVAEASPRQAEVSHYENRHDYHQRQLERERNHRLHEENERHEHEMRRRPFESRRAWHERQQREIERHRRAIHEIMRMGHHR